MAGLGIVKKSKTTVTREELVKRFPSKKTTVTDEVVDLINEANNDPEFNGDEFIENMMTYQNVMHKNSGSLSEYINALKFCAYLEADVNNYTEAYKRARANDEFVIERANLPKDSVGYRELTNAASRYRKTPMVRDILTQAEMPLYLMFQGARYGAVAKLVEEMDQAQFSKDRISAAKAILEHVKPPENMKVELDIGVKQDSTLEQLHQQLTEFADKSLVHLKNGSTDLTILGAMKVKEESDIIDADIDEDK